MGWIGWPAHQESSSVHLSQPLDHKCVLPLVVLGLEENPFCQRDHLLKTSPELYAHAGGWNSLRLIQVM